MDTKKITWSDTIVIGGGQAGLSAGYYLKQYGIPFIILDAEERTGDTWRKRWDSLRLFTPARYDSLPGLPFPAPKHSFPTKDQMGDYLQQYVKHFDLPVRNSARVISLSRQGDVYEIETEKELFKTNHAIVAMSNFQFPKVPPFAKNLAPGIRQFHSYEYRNLSQLSEGGVLVVGAGNSGAEIALEAARQHEVFLAGRDTGHIPFNVESNIGKKFLVTIVLRLIFFRLLKTSNVIGKKARQKTLGLGGPLIRHKPKHILRAGIHRMKRMTGVKDGKPLVDGKILEVKNVIWCTGYYPRFSWIDLPVFSEDHEPIQERGVVKNEPGLYFLGLYFLYAMASVMIHGVGRDAQFIAKKIKNRIDEKKTEKQQERHAALSA